MGITSKRRQRQEQQHQVLSKQALQVEIFQGNKPQASRGLKSPYKIYPLKPKIYIPTIKIIRVLFA